jgi:hypothetical protein
LRKEKDASLSAVKQGEKKDASLSAVKQGEKKDASLSAVKQGERRVALTKRFIGKTTTQEKGKDSHKAASTFCPPDGGKRHARGTRESASGGPAG